ncbi:Golgi apparatus membrane protein tvp23 [Microbotryomycetes sp. JL221]|nr:Golgi apparatus membrane protein tvp23 [Microbotryomycetes sp. JL221]
MSVLASDSSSQPGPPRPSTAADRLNEDDDDNESVDGPLFHPVPPPCTNGGILRNGPTSPPLSTATNGPPQLSGQIASPSSSNNSGALSGPRRRGASIVAKVVSITATPPEHYKELAPAPVHSPPLGTGRLSRSNSASRAEPGSRHNSDDDDDECDSDSDEVVEEVDGIERRKRDCDKVKFAPLPPGRRQYRSNSLSLGVAARAKMISAQGAPGDPRQARYAGPQQWYQGGTLPEEVYTIQDVQRGLKNIWSKVKSKRRASTSSTTSSNSTSETSSNQQESKEMESRAKGKSKEIEHIEEVDEHDDDDEADSPTASRSSLPDEAGDSPRGRAVERQLMPDNVGLDVPPPPLHNGPRRESVDSETTGTASSVGPKTPEDFQQALPLTDDGQSDRKGKGKAVDRRAMSPAES